MPPRKKSPGLPDTDDYLLHVPQGMIEPLIQTMTYMVAYYDGLVKQAAGTGHPGEQQNAAKWLEERDNVRHLLKQLEDALNGG